MHDNLKTGVSERIGSLVRFNETFLEFASFYGFTPRAANVRRGNEKGRVERGIQYLRTSFFEGRVFESIEDLNLQVLSWCQQVALDRPWQQDKTQKVADVFAMEQKVLPSLPPVPYSCLEILQVSIGKTPYARFDGNDYSVPFQHVSSVLELRASEKIVEIFQPSDCFNAVAAQLRCYSKGNTVEDSTHLALLAQRKAAATKHAALHKLTNEVAGAQEFVEKLAERGENLGGSVRSLLRMCEIHGPTLVSKAVIEVLASGSCTLRAVHFVLARMDKPQEEPELANTCLQVKEYSNLTVTHHDLNTYNTITGVKINAKSSDADS